MTNRVHWLGWETIYAISKVPDAASKRSSSLWRARRSVSWSVLCVVCESCVICICSDSWVPRYQWVECYQSVWASHIQVAPASLSLASLTLHWMNDKTSALLAVSGFSVTSLTDDPSRPSKTQGRLFKVFVCLWVPLQSLSQPEVIPTLLVTWNFTIWRLSAGRDGSSYFQPDGV